MRRACLLLALPAAVGLAGCLDPTEAPVDPPLDYAENLSEPDSLVQDLMVSYREREIGPYLNLLSADFQFRLQPRFVTETEDGLWDHDEDAAATAGVFAMADRIRVDLIRTPPADDTIRGQAVKRIDVTHTDLWVDIDGGDTTLGVSEDRQEFFFVQGRTAMGEDPGRWYLFQWHDLGDPEAHPAVEPSSWSRIKILGAPSAAARHTRPPGR